MAPFLSFSGIPSVALVDLDGFWGVIFLGYFAYTIAGFLHPLAPFPQNQEIKEAFDLFDTDGSGRKHMFGKAVHHLGGQGRCGISM